MAGPSSCLLSRLIFRDVIFVHLSSLAATAPQQEPEAEATADLPSKGIAQASGGSNQLRDTTASAPSDKDCDAEKNADIISSS